MTFNVLEQKLSPFEDPLSHPFAKWLYAHFPPRLMANKKVYGHYLKVVEILMEEIEEEHFPKSAQTMILDYIQSVTPFLEAYEKKEFPFKGANPEEVLRFLMEQNNLSQYDLAADFGGQPVVSDILNKRRKMTREQIERLSQRFRISPATFYPVFEKSQLNEPPAVYHIKPKKRKKPLS